MKTNLAATLVCDVLKKLGRAGRLEGREVIFTDGLAPPAEEVWHAARRAVRNRKTVRGEHFRRCFTAAEKQDIFRRASLAVGNSPASPQYADLIFWLLSLERVSSDDAELLTALDLLESGGVLTKARRNKIAKFELPVR